MATGTLTQGPNITKTKYTERERGETKKRPAKGRFALSFKLVLRVPSDCILRMTPKPVPHKSNMSDAKTRTVASRK